MRFVAINCLSSIAIVWFLSWCVVSFIRVLCCKAAAYNPWGACCLLRYFCGLLLTQFLQHLNCPFEKGAFLAFLSVPSVAGIMWLILQMRVVTLKQTHPCPGPHAFSLAWIFFFLLWIKTIINAFWSLKWWAAFWWMVCSWNNYWNVCCTGRGGQRPAVKTEDFQILRWGPLLFFPHTEEARLGLGELQGAPCLVVPLLRGLAWRLGRVGCECWIWDDDTWFERLHLFYFPSICWELTSCGKVGWGVENVTLW